MMAMNNANLAAELSHVLAWPSSIHSIPIEAQNSADNRIRLQYVRICFEVKQTMGTICRSGLHCFPLCDYTLDTLCV
jgi:hypothetical protein